MVKTVGYQDLTDLAGGKNLAVFFELRDNFVNDRLDFILSSKVLVRYKEPKAFSVSNRKNFFGFGLNPDLNKFFRILDLYSFYSNICQ